MRKPVISALAIFLILSLGFAAVPALALPNPPALASTTWEGKYEIAYKTGFKTGTMSVTFTNVSGALIRGTVNFSPPLGTSTSNFAGIIFDGELRMTAEDTVICAKLIYDNLGATPVWKIRGYWHCTWGGGGMRCPQK